MGNRVIVRFDDNSGPRFGVYLHWHGDEAVEWLNEAAHTMRRGDAGYAAARFVGYCCSQISGGLSICMMDVSECTDETAQWQDNGMLIVDVNDGEVRHVDRPGAKSRFAAMLEMGEF